MDSKKFTLYDFEYELFEDGSLFVERESGRVQVLPKYVRIKNGMYPRYALYEKGFDFSEKNKQLIERYNIALAAFNESQANDWIREGSRGEIVSSSIRDVSGPKYPTLYQNKGWRRFYINHASLVLRYWYGVTDDKTYPYFIDGNTYNLAVSNIGNQGHFASMAKRGGNGTSESLVNLVLANCGRYTPEYIGHCLDLSDVTVRRIIYGQGIFESMGDRKNYIGNIRSSRGGFYGIQCYEWEIVYDFINRVLCGWTNQARYQLYLNKGASRGIRQGKGRMPYGVWADKYAIDERGGKVLMKKWVELNQDVIDNVEELMTYIDGWLMGGDRCWSIDRYNSYMSNNRYRMPYKVEYKKGEVCSLSFVGVDNSKRTLWDLSDFQLVNLFDYCMGDFAFLPIESIPSIIDSFEDEPNWDEYQSHGYSSKEEFWKQYECLLGQGSLRDFRDSYKELLQSIAY